MASPQDISTEIMAIAALVTAIGGAIAGVIGVIKGNTAQSTADTNTQRIDTHLVSAGQQLSKAIDAVREGQALLGASVPVSALPVATIQPDPEPQPKE